MDFTQRSTESELMDNPELGLQAIKEAFVDINKCNNWLGGFRITIDAVDKLIKDHSKKSYTIVDVGCGDGEMLRKVAAYLQKHKIAYHLIGIDIQDDILAIARERSEDFPHISYLKQDVLTLKSDFDCDILLCTLTMHHFKDDRIPVLLKKFVALAKIGVVINDLQRSTLAYWLFKIFSLFFIKTHTAKYDGLVSIRRGFKRKELLALAKSLPDTVHSITWKWAFRYVWVIKTNRLK